MNQFSVMSPVSQIIRTVTSLRQHMVSVIQYVREQWHISIINQFSHCQLIRRTQPGSDYCFKLLLKTYQHTATWRQFLTGIPFSRCCQTCHALAKCVVHMSFVHTSWQHWWRAVTPTNYWISSRQVSLQTKRDLFLDEELVVVPVDAAYDLLI